MNMHQTLTGFPRTATAPRGLSFAAAAAGVIALQIAGIAPAAAKVLPGVFAGSSYSAIAQLKTSEASPTIHAGAAEFCPPKGTDGKTRTNTTADLSVGLLGSVVGGGVATATAYGYKTGVGATTRQTETIAKLSLLGGLITADEMTAVATVHADKKIVTGSTAGSTMLNLKIAGTAISPGIPNNTVIPLPNLGTVTIKADQVGSHKNIGKAGMTMLLVKITVANPLGLGVGAVLAVGHAGAAFKRTS